MSETEQRAMAPAKHPKLSVVIATYNNAAILQECLSSWETYAGDQPVELIVIADGCKDNTSELLEKLSASPWGAQHLRWYTEDNVHELLCTNRGMKEAKGELILSWHDDMFLNSHFMVPELISFFDKNDDVGLMGLCRGLDCKEGSQPKSWEELTDPSRLISTVGPKYWNWFFAIEVDAIIRPWVTRKICIDKVGLLDTAFKLSEWDEADFCYRISQNGWKISVHAYERLGAYKHLGSSTIRKTSSDAYRTQVLENGQLFYSRWSTAILANFLRPRLTWCRPLSFMVFVYTVAAIVSDFFRRLRKK